MHHGLQGEGDNHMYPTHHKLITPKNAIWKKVQVNCIKLLFANWSLKGSLHVLQSELQKYSESGFFKFFFANAT